mgnify:CR=1 FL=1
MVLTCEQKYLREKAKEEGEKRRLQAEKKHRFRLGVGECGLVAPKNCFCVFPSVTWWLVFHELSRVFSSCGGKAT